MDFKKKLKIRLYMAICYIIIGVMLIAVNFAVDKNHEIVSSFGSAFIVIGIVRIVQYIRINKDEESIRRQKIAETDERNIMIWTQARSLTFAIYTMLAAVSIFVLYLLGMELQAQMIAYTLCAFVLIYLICYLILKRKY